MVTVGNELGKRNGCQRFQLADYHNCFWKMIRVLSRLWLRGWFGRTGIHSLTKHEGSHQHVILFMPHLMPLPSPFILSMAECPSISKIIA